MTDLKTPTRLAPGLAIFSFLLILPAFAAHAQAMATEADLHPRTPPPVSGRNPLIDTEIVPANVLARVGLFRAELELLRAEMGRPKNRQTELEVRNAAPREVFFQALTLYRKADRLCTENAMRSVAEPATPPAAEISPAHVWRAVDAALGRLLQVKRQLGIPELSRELAQPLGTEPAAVFRSIVQANRQLNLLLERRFSPSDVFQHVTKATNYATRLLETFPGAKRRPKEPLFVRKKTPPDVYRRLLASYRLLTTLAEVSGLAMLTIEVPAEELEHVGPSDVYDIASLLVSELSYLHSHLRGIRPPAEAYYPGSKLPSHVYQRAGMLEAQFAELLERGTAQPRWLESRDAL